MKKLLPLALFCVIAFFSCKSTDVAVSTVSETQQLFNQLQECVFENDVASLKNLVDNTSPKLLRSVINNATENNGRTLLHVAVWDEYPEIVKVLLENGASKTIKDDAGKTAVDYAKKAENKVVKELFGIKDSEKKETAKQETEPAVSEVPAKKPSHGFTDASGSYDVVFGATDSKLLVAVKEQNYGEVKKLLESNTNVNVTDLLGNNALFYAINSEHDGIINLLLSYNINCNFQNNAGQLPFLYAVDKGNIAIITALLKAGVSINKADVEGTTAELLAVQKRDAGLLKFLESKGSYLSSTDSKGNTLLHVAVKNEDVISVKFLLQNDCDVWATNDSGVSVLEMMKESKHSGIRALAQDYE